MKDANSMKLVEQQVNSKSKYTKRKLRFMLLLESIALSAGLLFFSKIPGRPTKN